MPALTYETSKRGYANLWNRAQIRPERVSAANAVARRLHTNRARYQAAALGSMPWWWVAITHNLESGANFSRHLHNGDPLTARTRQVPAGRPKTGTPPFTWEESARDALQLKNLDRVQDWSVARCLYEFERYNGWGYVARKINSPYVWSFTTLYSRGKYVADGKFSASAVSQQCGAAATMKAMEALKLITIGKPTMTEEQKQAVQIDKPLPPIVVSPVVKRPDWDIVGWVVEFLKGFFR